ncbi:eCIS core domain-containing protein [Dyadobacter arcticus]|uniref:eCIS core domain-containing protein n=1 Tax=Dyadobacter arcticus TaxID=1078754 RepID=A0ABX0UNX4_9BACT|nr:DUF4157 domain-containing protein [Dyadobacter arcticus]NIJ54693.1 hypothetical protein [Dyadobacter arcticus]
MSEKITISARSQGAGPAALHSADTSRSFLIQPKLTIGDSNDHFEQQADRVADHVMSMSATHDPTSGGSDARIQRKCATCAHEEEHLQRKPFNITPIIQTTGAQGAGDASSFVSGQIASVRGGGSPMNERTRSFMESRFGSDFSSVKIHTDSTAIQLSQELNAQAFTVGNDVFFNRGKYNPESNAGKHLLAHELTHTLQQGEGKFYNVQRQAALAYRPAPVIRPPAPARPPLRVIQGGGGYRASTGTAATSPSSSYSAPVYVPDAMDDSLDAMFARARIRGNRDQAVFEAERPVATLTRGGSSPGFLTTGRQQSMIGEGWSAVFTPHYFHILDMIEYQVGVATSERQIEAIRDSYLPSMSNSPFGPYGLSPVYLPYHIPEEMDPGQIERRRVFSRAVRRRIAAMPSLRGVERLAVETDVETALERMGRQRRNLRAYPICWAVQLGPPSSLNFVRTSADRDDQEARQARMQLEWRRFRDPDFDPARFHVHHVNPLFLGGADDLQNNGTLIEKRRHLRGHDVLRFQPQLVTPISMTSAPYTVLPPLGPDLYRHPAGTLYEVIGFKQEAHELCAF